jgi:hypothetical protein
MMLLSNKASALGGDSGSHIRDQTATKPRTISHQNRGDEGEEEKDLSARKRVKSKNEIGGGKDLASLKSLEGAKVATLRVILLGSCNVGKTSIINKYVHGVFYEKPTTTVGVDFAKKSISRDELKQRSTSTCSDFAAQQQLL